MATRRSEGRLETLTTQMADDLRPLAVGRAEGTLIKNESLNCAPAHDLSHFRRVECVGAGRVLENKRNGKLSSHPHHSQSVSQQQIA